MIPTALPRRRFFLLAFAILAGLLIAAPAVTRVNAQEPKPLLAPEPKIISIEVGFSGTYKLGCWTPLTVELLGGSEACVGRVIASVPDTDGIQTRTLSDASRPVGIEPRKTTKVRMLIRVGQSMSPVKIQFVSNNGKLTTKRDFEASYSDQTDVLQGGVPATNRLLLEFGPTLILNDVIQADQRTDEQLTTHVARVERAEDLPTHWSGYEAVDTVLFSTSDPELFRPLLQNRKRIAALENWIERGGRLVLFCASSAEELLSNDGALASFSPGKFEEMEQLTQSEPLEIFSGSGHPIGDRRVKLSTPSLVDVRGKILVSAGRNKTTLPLVVRTQRGFGEIVFVGLDFDRPPLRDWPGRTSFLQRVFDWQDGEKNKQTVEQTDVEDLSSLLRASLDKKFVDVQVIPFGWVALLVGIYILLIGPGDYFFVKRFLRRMELTWLTFPLIVCGVSAAAYGIANYMKGDQLLVNQVEIIDVDCTQDGSQDNKAANFARGVVWTHFYTPQVSELDLTLQPSYFGQTELAKNQQVVSWLGLPGYALGGMQANGSQTSVFDAGYQFGNQQASIERLPVQVWSTKTITARWSARVEMPIQVELQQDGAELLLGQIQNNTDIELEDCMLLYGHWAYHLGRMPVGRVQKIDDSLRPRTVKTTLTSATAGDNLVSVHSTTDDGTVKFAEEIQWDMARLAKIMMFYKAINGPSYTERQNRYQSFVDLSGVLEHDDRAILLVRNNTPGTNWQANGEPLANKKDRRWTYYRFVLKVESPATKEE